jgi:hypothetical protein
MQLPHNSPGRVQFGLWTLFVAMLAAAVGLYCGRLLMPYLFAAVLLFWFAIFLACGVLGVCLALDSGAKILPAFSERRYRRAVWLLLGASILWLAVVHWFRPPDVMDLIAMFRPNPTYVEQLHEAAKAWARAHRGLVNGTLCFSWGLTGFLAGMLKVQSRQPSEPIAPQSGQPQ